MRLIIILFLLSFFAGTEKISCQNAFPFFVESDEIPMDLLKERSVVFMNVEDLNWQPQAGIIHQFFKNEGVDAVAYYALSDILSGHDATSSFYKDITDRSIDNMIILHQDQEGYHLYITKIPQNGKFFVDNMAVYQLSAGGLEDLGALFTLQVDRAGLPRENFLIIDIPEIFWRTNVIKTRRVENYNPDLRIDKLAVPKFEEGVMMKENVANANEQLDSIMSKHYPFRYGLVPADISDEEMIAQGYLMVLRRLENNGESLKRMLGYPINENETLYISVRKGEQAKVEKFSKAQTVHKYYVQQLYTKDVYLGAEWDADVSWQEALINHTDNIKAALKDR